ncbi:hypothetical protein SAMN05444008_10314 [Cnuella takakiae]|uniref:Uncharacterized protein n=1 Tax=Cnuella takakiae TaxID=1302690 RepID=A0A1M4WFP1_9BACT|nr:DUF6717 family protein [Cnuella takakiae]OLY91730.1 hypothetical protein BUE76_07325 [Cnuella takakiae]SHE80046.1 hypothetical protein SAMN05444008_10314 [Cnuella takakiae]
MHTLVQPSVAGISITPGDIQELTIFQEEGRWYIGIAKYLKSKSHQAFTEVASITDGLMQWIARRRKRFTVFLHTQPFEGARMLELVEMCTGPEGGAFYRVSAQRSPSEHRIWVCDTSLLVFGDLPQRIFFKLGNKE